MITRLAPTPSGFLHAGNIYNFLLNWLWARSNGGKVLLRIDDGDAERKRPEYVEDIFRVLGWLGLDWETGPTGPDDFEQHWSQARRKDVYVSMLNELVRKERVFACTCTRKQPVNGTLPHTCACRQMQMPLSKPGAAWRILTDNNTLVTFLDKALGTVAVDLQQTTGPFVVRKKDGHAAYQLCSLADDGHSGVTHICRGEDLLPSTAMQLYIDRRLDAPGFINCNFWHHPLLSNAQGAKLSKSAGALSSSIMGIVNKNELLGSFAQWMGWNNGAPMSLNEMTGMDCFVVDKC
jgi:glutamyl/glutaminyl-tRNA synthetase